MFAGMIDTTKQLIDGKQKRIDREKQEKAHQDKLIQQFDHGLLLEDIDMNLNIDDRITRNFDHTYALIYCNSDFQELNKMMKMADLPLVKSNLMIARSTVQMLQIKPDNVYELVDANSVEIKEIDKKLQEKIAKHAKAGETVMIYAYATGRGFFDGRQ